jgi:hypothetical protein
MSLVENRGQPDEHATEIRECAAGEVPCWDLRGDPLVCGYAHDQVIAVRFGDEYPAPPIFLVGECVTY